MRHSGGEKKISGKKEIVRMIDRNEAVIWKAVEGI